MREQVAVALGLSTLVAAWSLGCGSDPAPADAPAASAGSAGTGGTIGSGAAGGSGGAPSAGNGGTAGNSAGGAGASAGQGGTLADWPTAVGDRTPDVDTTPNPGWGGIRVLTSGGRDFVIESSRTVEPGPLSMPWRSRFRLVAYEAGAEKFRWEAPAEAQLADVVVHPSGALTLAVQQFGADSATYQLVRLGADGKVAHTQPFAAPSLPAAEPSGGTAPPALRMVAWLPEALSAGWVRLVADGEGVLAAILSLADFPEGDPRRLSMVTAVSALRWGGSAYEQRWARLVDDLHRAEPASWAYDELRWREQAVRPFLAVDSSTGDVLVGRAWNRTRCQANVARFAEFTQPSCVLASVDPLENERLPLAVTRFDKDGERVGTIVLAPDEDAVEQVPFDLRANDGELVVVGSVVRADSNGDRRLAEDGSFAYDGFLATFDASGAQTRRQDFDSGSGDVLAAVTPTTSGWLAVGSSGWRRGTGGMSISKGADPWLVAVDRTGASRARSVPLSNGSRHFTLHDVALDADGSRLVAVGFADAPMTHSADGGNTAAMTFGGLMLSLSR